MKVYIKQREVREKTETMSEIALYTENPWKHRGDLAITRKGLIWCIGNTTPPKGKLISWEDLIDDIEHS